MIDKTECKNARHNQILLIYNKNLQNMMMHIVVLHFSKFISYWKMHHRCKSTSIILCQCLLLFQFFLDAGL